MTTFRPWCIFRLDTGPSFAKTSAKIVAHQSERSATRSGFVARAFKIIKVGPRYKNEMEYHRDHVLSPPPPPLPVPLMLLQLLPLSLLRPMPPLVEVDSHDEKDCEYFLLCRLRRFEFPFVFFFLFLPSLPSWRRKKAEQKYPRVGYIC